MKNERVLVPGEPERLCRAERSVEGIPIDDKSWRTVVDAAKGVGVTASAIQAVLSSSAE